MWMDAISKFEFKGHFEGHQGHCGSKLGLCLIYCDSGPLSLKMLIK